MQSAERNWVPIFDWYTGATATGWTHKLEINLFRCCVPLRIRMYLCQGHVEGMVHKCSTKVIRYRPLYWNIGITATLSVNFLTCLIHSASCFSSLDWAVCDCTTGGASLLHCVMFMSRRVIVTSLWTRLPSTCWWAWSSAPENLQEVARSRRKKAVFWWDPWYASATSCEFLFW